MKHHFSKVGVYLLIASMATLLFSCSSSRVEDLEKIKDFHFSTTKSFTNQLATSGDRGGSCVDLYIDYSDCMITATQSDYYQSVQPAIIACNPSYYSIKGNEIKFESNDKMKVHQLLNTITNVDYSNIKGAVDSIISKNREAILITDGEFYQKGIGANLNNPYLADEFKKWLTNGHDVYVYSEPYTYDGFCKNRYYMLFTDHRIDNNIQQIFSRNAPKDDSVKMVHLYSGIPSAKVKNSGLVFNEQLLITPDQEVNPTMSFECHTMDAAWDDVYDYVLNATDDNGNQIKGGDFFFKGIKVNVSEEDAYMPSKIEVVGYEISDIYEEFNPKKTKITLPTPLEKVFVLDDNAWKKGEVVVKLHPEFDGSTLSGTSGNLLRIDIRVKSSKENFTSNSNIGNNFKFPSPWGFNTSIYESLKQTLNDPSISPENSGDPVIYTVYLSTFTK